MPPRVSVIVAVKNGGRTLQACLASIRAQDQPVELVVVENFSTDATHQIARRFADVLIVSGPERSAQRNVGFRASKGDHVLFIDADMVLRPDVVRACLATGAEAVIVPEESVGDSFWAKVKALERSLYAGTGVEAARYFSRRVFEATGMYDEDLIAGEDWDLSRRASLLTAVCRANTLIHHLEGPATLRGYLIKKHFYGTHLARYLRKTRKAGKRDLSGRLGMGRLGIYARGWRTLARQPRYGAAVLLLLGLEAAAGGIGVLQGIVKGGMWPTIQGN